MTRKRYLYLLLAGFILVFVPFHQWGQGEWWDTVSVAAFAVGILGICVELAKIYRSESRRGGQAEDL